MAQQPSLRIYRENGVTSRYSLRFTQQEKEIIKPLLRHLTQQGVNRVGIAKEVSRHCGRTISTSQIDTLRKEEGLLLSKRSSFDTLRHGRFPFESRGPLPVESGPLGSESNTIFDFDFELMEFERTSGNDEPVSELGAEVSDVARTLSEQGQNSTSTTWDVLMSTDTVFANMHENSAAQMSSVNVPVANGDTRRMQSIPSFHITMDIQEHGQMDPANSDAGENADPTSPRNILTRAINSCMTIQQHGKYSEDGILRLQYAAMVLYTLKEFEMAFILYLLLFNQFQRVLLDTQTRTNAAHGALLTVFAINCARSAQSTPHAQNALTLLGEIREMGLLFHAERSVEEYIHILREQLSQTQIHSTERQPELDSPKFAARYMEIVRLSRSRSAEALDRYFVPRTFVPDMSLIHLYECSITKASICNAVEMIVDFLGRQHSLVDGMLSEYWKSVQNDACVALTLSCMLLEDKTVHATFPILYESNQSTQLQDHGEFPCYLNGQAVIGIVFALLKWTRKQIFHNRTTRPSSYYRFAAIYLRSKITSNHSEYCDFLDTFLVEMVHPDLYQSIDSPGVSQERLLNLALELAGLLSSSPIPASNPDAGMINAQNLQSTIHQSTQGHLPISQVERPVSTVETVRTANRSSAGSSDWLLFCATSDAARLSVATSVLTECTSFSTGGSSNSSDRFSRVTGISSLPSINESARSSIASAITVRIDSVSVQS